ncbi:response regulator [Sphingomonas baiyangensis]|uniref:histidine kinase n=1 Tax=Sphingomonas baiyangensis TaxID=2572576 RepID=A0A4U1L5W7_9SPHN|nr:response regulator [Sphingomonas baiyangensis]
MLYIDDDEGLRRLVARAMARRGYEVATAGDGASGVAMARERRFDLIAIDHYMPGLDGLETLAQVQALPDPPPVVYVTGSDEAPVAIAALKSGAVDYVVKAVGDDFFDLLAQSFDAALEKVRLAAANAAIERELREANARLETLLREVDHRVANSLQLVSAFVNMQAMATADEGARRALADTQHRIEAVAAVHRALYTADSADSVALDGYLATLVEGLGQSYGAERRVTGVTLDAEPVTVAADRAVSIGIIVTELVSNAVKYAYRERDPGPVCVSLAREADGGILVRVSDEGCGLPPDGASEGTGLGMRVVQAMARSLRGTFGSDTPPSGTCFSLRFAG